MLAETRFTFYGLQSSRILNAAADHQLCACSVPKIFAFKEFLTPPKYTTHFHRWFEEDEVSFE